MRTSYGQFTLTHGVSKPRSRNRAKRLECEELAPAFGRPAPANSASKLAALQTLRAVGTVLWSACLALMLTATRAPAAPGEQTVEEKPRSIVAVFRLDGPVTEVPADDLEQLFGPPGVSLKE